MIDLAPLRLALRLARRGCGATSPNPMVGAVLAKAGRVIGRGWHRRAGEPHAEVEALQDAQRRGHNPRGATLYVTLEPCCTHGRTPPCTKAIISAGIRRVVVGAVDPNPKHAGRAFAILRQAGIAVVALAPAGSARARGHGVLAPRRPRRRSGPEHRLARACIELNEAFNHWIVHRTPFVTVKAAMSLDGKIAIASGESKWITSERARRWAMRLRRQADAILVGVNTVLADDPALTVRTLRAARERQEPRRRIILDSMARTPLTARVVGDAQAPWTTIVVSRNAPPRRVAALARRVKVLVAPTAPKARHAAAGTGIDPGWLLARLGAEAVTHLLVEGGGEVNASFLLRGWAQRVAFFYAPRILGGRADRRGVAGAGVCSWDEIPRVEGARWKRIGPDLMLSGRVAANGPGRRNARVK